MLPLWSRQIIVFSLIWAALNLVVIVAPSGMIGPGASGLVAWQAHLGGYLAGLLLAGPFDALRPQPVNQQI